MRTGLRFVLPIALLFLPARLLLSPAGASVLAPVAVSETTLGNGLRVAVYENHSAPLADVLVWYKVGSYYETAGHTGLSHFLEHMMFNGTRKYGPRKYSGLIEAQGGRENASTSDHVTVYWNELAADRYELALKLEADRMENLLLDSAQTERERNVVMEERRLGENSPTGALFETFDTEAYKVHPYRNPVVGWMDDLKRITRHDLVAHYEKFYTPSNAVLVVAGDVKPAVVFAQARRYFGKIKSHPVPPIHPVEPPQTAERRIELHRDVKSPSLMIGYHVPGTDDPDFYTFEVIQSLLFRGRSARLPEKMVHRTSRASNVSGGNDVTIDPGLFYFSVSPRTPALLDSVEQDVYAELESLKTVPVWDSELLQVKNQVIAGFIFGQGTSHSMARQIGFYYTIHGSLDMLNAYPDRIAAVTKEDVMKAARKYFTPENRTVAQLLPDVQAPGKEKK